MKTLTRKACLFGLALILAVILTVTTGLPRRAYAGCGAGVSWGVSNQLDSRQNSDGTQDTSSRSVQHSNDGQDWDDTQTSHTNPDGSSHTHEESNYTDSEGNGCNSD